MLPASDRMEGSPGRVWSYDLVSGPPCHSNRFHPRPCALGSQETTALTPQSLGLPRGEAKGAGVGRAGGAPSDQPASGTVSLSGQKGKPEGFTLEKD